jgi:hypothetical protein
MSKFITVTTFAWGKDDEKKHYNVRLNIKYIQSYYPEIHSIHHKSKINCEGDDSGWFVLESVDEIDELIRKPQDE